MMDGQAHEVEVSLETMVEPAFQGARTGQAERGARAEQAEMNATKVEQKEQDTTRAEQVGLKTTNSPRPPYRSRPKVVPRV
ncbi:hypothetical protein PO909_010672 [Leuciscus waleckii]